MSAVIYLTLKHPATWKRLEGEILGSELSADRPVSYKESRNLPYLNAVIRESMRLHPVVGMALERYVPAGGLQLPDGSCVPAGAAVGMNPFLVNRTSVFGEDSEAFRPERWLQGPQENSDSYKTRLASMNDTDLTFGAGSRVCSGRHIANLELYKVIPTLIKRFRMELVDAEKEWEVKNGWFLRQTGVNVRLTRR